MSSSTRPEFQQLQQTFTQHLRDPEVNPAPADIEDRRMAIYRRLFFNNVSSFLGNSFPVLRKIYSDENWERLMRDYFSQHVAHTPLFPRMPSEFVQYLQNERQAQDDDPDFLTELAHYEWMGMSLRFDGRAIPQQGYDDAGDLLQGIPVTNPLLELLSYRYPVQAISPSNIPEQAPEQPTYLVVFRDREDSVGFMELNPVSARLLALLLENQGLTGEQILQQIATELQHPKPEVVVDGGRAIFDQLKARDVVLGASV